MSLEEGKQFWAFKPVSNPALPPVSKPDWLQSPIDAFILSRLDELNVQPAPAADKRTLIRRVYLDLVGFPPTADEVNRFLSDSSEGAFRDVVERLLASPQYGVRWGRHWLDVVRYADSNGLDENIAFGNAWRFRDYVVQSFNDDKPYQQFIIEQIAGDLLPQATQQTRTATGFLALGAKVLAEPDMDKLLMDTVDEQIDTVGKTFMGLTLGCARCHDHKFDPLLQADYYAMAAIFKGTRSFSGDRYGAIKYWYEHSFADQDELENLKQVDEEIAAAKRAASQFRSQAMSAIRDQARKLAADYLMAATKIEAGASLVDAAQVANPLGLHPRILHHCRQHLENQRNEPFFEAWHHLASDSAAVREHYASLFDRLDLALQATQQTDSGKPTLEDPQLEQVRHHLADPAGFLAIPPQPEFAFDEETYGEYHRLMEAARILESNAPDRTAAMGVADDIPQQQLPIHIRGSHLNLGEPVPRGFPVVLAGSSGGPVFADHQSGRLELAQWLASTSNPLTARVMVNRIWGWHFGRPLVFSTENFGVTGDAPTHPELLDWLARYFMKSGWSIKQMHRILLNSSAYQMASDHPFSQSGESADPMNESLWKFRIQRMSAEQLRDSILASTGRLDYGLHGKTVPLRNHQFVFDHTSIDHTRYDSWRRSVYLPVIRNNLYSVFEQFDFPDPTMPTGSRRTTTVAPQSLLLMNSQWIIDSAEHVAAELVEQVSHRSERLDLLFMQLLGRPPSCGERASCLRYVSQEDDVRFLDSAADASAERLVDREIKRWALLAQSLLATNDFLYIR
jgi:hypothetical protein